MMPPTCHCDRVMRPHEDGWVCPGCGEVIRDLHSNVLQFPATAPAPGGVGGPVAPPDPPSPVGPRKAPEQYLAQMRADIDAAKARKDPA